MIRSILYLFAVALVMLLYVAAYFIALKPLSARSVRSASRAQSELHVRPESNHHQSHRNAAYQIPFLKPTALPAGFLQAFFAPVHYVDARWVRPGYWGIPEGHP